VVAIGIVIDGVKYCKSLFGKILGRWNAIKDHGFVIWHAVQKSDNRRVTGINQKRMIPAIDKMLLR